MFVTRVCLRVTRRALIAFSCLVTIISELFAQRMLSRTHVHIRMWEISYLDYPYSDSSHPICKGRTFSPLIFAAHKRTSVTYRNKQLKREANGRPFPFHSLLRHYSCSTVLNLKKQLQFNSLARTHTHTHTVFVIQEIASELWSNLRFFSRISTMLISFSH
jgi:hypothetical protein